MSKRVSKQHPLSTGSEWTDELIRDYDREIGRLARDFKLDTYPNQIEIITAEQMMDAYASVGMPIGYHHWSFGGLWTSKQNENVCRLNSRELVLVNVIDIVRGRNSRTRRAKGGIK